jgi:hypothetical protein
MEDSNAFSPKVSGQIVADSRGEWQGMPEYEHTDKTSFRKILVHFKDQDAVDRFAQLIGQSVGEKLKYIWYPEAEIERYADKVYQADA